MHSSLQLIQPFWQSTTMLAEPVLFTHSPDTPLPTARLAFTPTRILSVESATRQTTFQPTRDYTHLSNSRELALPPHSTIPFKTHAQLHLPKGSQPIGSSRDGLSDLLFSEGHFFHDLQTVITYEHALDDWQTPPSLLRTFSLPHTAALLQNKKPLHLLILGDSISTGANASENTHAPPHQPAYPHLLAAAIEAHFHSSVNLTNLSVGGKNSAWALDQLPQALATKPDLAILAFGMNDAAKLTTAEYLANMTRLTQSLLQLPHTDIILIATMAGNPEWIGSAPDLYPQYRDVLQSLIAPRVALADLTTLWQLLTARKSYLDLTGNGLNHPNDFGHRLYAQTLWAILTNLTPA